MLDRAMFALWQMADGCELEQIVTRFRKKESDPSLVRAAVCCLAEAQLLARNLETEGPDVSLEMNGPLVSVVIVSYNSQDWLTDCLNSVLAQTYSPLEIVVIDNHSSDHSSRLVKEKFPEVSLVNLEQTQSFARAINQGISQASGEYFSLLNPDVKLKPDAIAQLVSRALQNPDCAAVASELKFLWAPAFLNGLGNYVGAFSWGTDLGLGHLDLGQFEDFGEVPSACFASTLIPRQAWNAVGALDEGFPLYYEDTEWSYRARLLGFSIPAAPNATVYHAFSGRVPSIERSAFTPQKLRRVVYGRLQFATKILERANLLHFLRNYFLEDVLNILLALFTGRWGKIGAYSKAWSDYLKSFPQLRQERRKLQSRRVNEDKIIFQPQRKAPIPLIRNGLPQLTWDSVRSHYYPLILSGRTRRFPEFEGFPAIGKTNPPEIRHPNLLKRAGSIWRAEGFRGLLHRIWRFTQWSLMQP